MFSERPGLPGTWSVISGKSLNLHCLLQWNLGGQHQPQDRHRIGELKNGVGLAQAWHTESIQRIAVAVAIAPVPLLEAQQL